MDVVVIAVVVTVAIVLAVYFSLSSKSSSVSSSPIIKASVDATKPITAKAPLPLSYDDPKGLTFSYTCWILVNDFTYRIGEQKVIFTKGPEDFSSMCPGVFLDGNTNTILVKIDTFGAQEIIPISNIPAKKWIHFGLVATQDAADVFINGVLHTHHSLAQPPRQNESSLHVGLAGGFQGQVADLNYYNYALTPQQVAGSMGTAPTVSTDTTQTPATPPYSDITWWTGRTG